MNVQARMAAYALCAATLFASPVSFAAYTGPSTTSSYQTVAEVLKNPVDDAAVTLTGFITKQIGKEKYLFTDGTAEIRLDIDQKYFPSAPINEKVKVRISGEVEKDFMQQPEIDVEQVTIVS